MASKTTKVPTGANGGTLGIVAHDQAINTRVDTLPLAIFQAVFVARRTRLAPAHAKLIAEHAFDRRWA